MRVLWFAVTSSLYESKVTGHNGGGWISSLEGIVRSVKDIELGIAFEHTDLVFKKEIDDVTYYPINAWTSMRSRLEKKIQVESEEKYIIPKCMDVITDFKPDVIHIFGSEWSFGLITQHTKVPVVIHMQGSLPSYYNARFPVGVSLWDIIFSSKISMLRKLIIIKGDLIFKKKALREEKILQLSNNFMGRTHWDKSIVHLYNPEANYYFCNEALRESFVDTSTHWTFHEYKKIIIASTISGPWYKGVDVVLKTAKLLKENTPLDFEWRIYGLTDCSFYEKHFSILSTDVNVKIMGVVNQETLLTGLLEANFYVHPSYIDNSPNSVCEAQILGIPVICTNVGGVSSLVEDKKTGFLVPANDPIKIADIVVSEYNNKLFLNEISKNEISIAKKRHSPDTIKKDLIMIYNKMVSDK